MSQNFFQLEVQIKGMSNSKGKIMVALYDKNSFMKKPLRTATAQISRISEGVSLVFDNLPAGEYAISTYHDENNNDRLDTNFLGMPTEKYGFSNNAPARFGAPTFEKAKIVFKESQVHKIKIE